MLREIYNQATFSQMQAAEPPPPRLPHASNPSHLPINHPNSQSAYELSVVAQYLDLTQQSNPYNSPQFPIIEGTESPSAIQTKPEGQVKRSSAFHNFQKHVITTLKRQVKLRKICSSKSTKASLAWELWQFFISSPRASKKFLFSLLGDNSFLNLIKNDPKGNGENLVEMLAGMKEAEVREAQGYLRGVIVKQAQQMVKGELLRGRRIQRAQEFTLYFREFAKELEEGFVSPRLPKSKRIELLSQDAESHFTSQ